MNAVIAKLLPMMPPIRDEDNIDGRAHANMKRGKDGVWIVLAP
jgi:hypothetical protein